MYDAGEPIDFTKYAELSRTSPDFIELLDYMRLKQGSGREIYAEAVAQRLNLPIRRVTEIFSEMQDARMGVYTIGRRGGKTRFVCRTDVQNLMNIIDGWMGTSIDEEKPVKSTNVRNYTFPLRSDFMVNFSLPSNLKLSEALRLAKHIETLGL